MYYSAASDLQVTNHTGMFFRDCNLMSICCAYLFLFFCSVLHCLVKQLIFLALPSGQSDTGQVLSKCKFYIFGHFDSLKYSLFFPLYTEFSSLKVGLDLFRFRLNIKYFFMLLYHSVYLLASRSSRCSAYFREKQELKHSLIL